VRSWQLEEGDALVEGRQLFANERAAFEWDVVCLVGLEVSPVERSLLSSSPKIRTSSAWISFARISESEPPSPKVSLWTAVSVRRHVAQGVDSTIGRKVALRCLDARIQGRPEGQVAAQTHARGAYPLGAVRMRHQVVDGGLGVVVVVLERLLDLVVVPEVRAWAIVGVRRAAFGELVVDRWADHDWTRVQGSRKRRP
jgi:hypothetical protein